MVGGAGSGRDCATTRASRIETAEICGSSVTSTEKSTTDATSFLVGVITGQTVAVGRRASTPFPRGYTATSQIGPFVAPERYRAAMAKVTAQYRCAECGWTTAKWVGRCGECQAWGTVEEVGSVKARTVTAAHVTTPAVPIVTVPTPSIVAVAPAA